MRTLRALLLMALVASLHVHTGLARRQLTQVWRAPEVTAAPNNGTEPAVNEIEAGDGMDMPEWTILMPNSTLLSTSGASAKAYLETAAVASNTTTTTTTTTSGNATALGKMGGNNNAETRVAAGVIIGAAALAVTVASLAANLANWITG